MDLPEGFIGFYNCIPGGGAKRLQRVKGARDMKVDACSNPSVSICFFARSDHHIIFEVR
jgi:hypothetical protein